MNGVTIVTCISVHWCIKSKAGHVDTLDNMQHLLSEGMPGVLTLTCCGSTTNGA